MGAMQWRKNSRRRRESTAAASVAVALNMTMQVLAAVQVNAEGSPTADALDLGYKVIGDRCVGVSVPTAQ